MVSDDSRGEKSAEEREMTPVGGVTSRTNLELSALPVANAVEYLTLSFARYVPSALMLPSSDFPSHTMRPGRPAAWPFQVFCTSPALFTMKTSQLATVVGCRP